MYKSFYLQNQRQKSIDIQAKRNNKLKKQVEQIKTFTLKRMKHMNMKTPIYWRPKGVPNIVELDSQQLQTISGYEM